MGGAITKRRLRSLNYEKIPRFSLCSKNRWVYVSSVYDGDTVTVIMFHNDKKPYSFALRMEGYDSPEIHPSKNALYRDQEIIAGQQARNYLSSLCLHKILWLECDPKKNDKYGRLLGKLYNDDVRNPKRICINDIMLRDGYGYEYNGNKKMPFNPNQWKPRIQHKILDS